ncbi:MAG: HlyD family efflux transporter periplasmic adaptor subunit [Rhodocyclaceae bacterium]|nr:HlyD family efflux transporter periplasmic adaptor subunit [Rhodocyclaceae bacterium]MCA3081351.1 HlyD family efflux transporter periplasmic adaptor subunit [Rhodocyclaceae bacterium]MCA3085804.1 HlyD family efflux transporter periplasmic adaptor subunit [Rhodocyclaceae bacterium]
MLHSYPWHHSRSVATRAALIGLVSLLLAACDEQHSAPPAPPAMVGASGYALASAKGKVDIEGGVIRLAARRDGVIAEVLVEEGARVKRGQVLALLDDATARSNLSLAEREVQQAAKEREKSAVELAAAEREVMRLEPLARNETVPRQELDRARDAHALAAVAVQTALASIETARARQAVAAREVEERKVVAPLDGQVIQRQARPGNGVSTLNVTPLFLFAPDVPRIVRAELEEQYLSVVAPNQAAEIVLEADNAQTWRGNVLRVGRVVGARTPSDDPGEKQDNRVVEVVVSFEDAPTLLIGQRVVVRLLANTR